MVPQVDLPPLLPTLLRDDVFARINETDRRGPPEGCVFEMRPFWSHFKIREGICRHRIRCSGGALEQLFRIGIFQVTLK